MRPTPAPITFNFIIFYFNKFLRRCRDSLNSREDPLKNREDGSRTTRTESEAADASRSMTDRFRFVKLLTEKETSIQILMGGRSIQEVASAPLAERIIQQSFVRARITAWQGSAFELSNLVTALHGRHRNRAISFCLGSSTLAYAILGSVSPSCQSPSICVPTEMSSGPV